MERHYVGPSFQQIAARYRDRADAVDYLAGKIRNGSVGAWGRTVMPRHPQVTEAQAREMAQWLVSLPVPSVAAPGALAGVAAGLELAARRGAGVSATMRNLNLLEGRAHGVLSGTVDARDAETVGRYAAGWITHDHFFH